MPIAAIKDERARGTYIRLRQTKARGGKGRRVTIPVGAPLKVALDAALQERRSAVTILSNSRGLLWTAAAFGLHGGRHSTSQVSAPFP
jgi:hypothetical protein